MDLLFIVILPLKDGSSKEGHTYEASETRNFHGLQSFPSGGILRHDSICPVCRYEWGCRPELGGLATLLDCRALMRP
ncbi:hypothetical protein Naga_100120g5 [Nannochloropsis gaditana]|uniref:Uncharacterized protein n=1 Tax=Nannochloropsis gaditana TaxID=72520 RepID=W7TPU9_9STRA|nr:hypothetical protein Naga_100120g5 [Nannochloropsis gaditana]